MKGKRLRFWRREEGSVTVEFVILFPLVMSIFLMGFESGYYMVQRVMLGHAVDVAVRDIRLGNGRIPNYDDLRKNICESAVVLSDCGTTENPNQFIHVHMEEIAIEPGALAAVGPARCLNRFSDEPDYDGSEYIAGQANTMMLIQVCASVSPFFPTTGLGAGMARDELGGDLAIVSTSVFVTEPGSRAISESSGGV